MADIHPQVIVIGGSLIAILALAALARWMRLGGNPKLRDEASVHHAAGEVEDGFDAQRVSIDRSGLAALASSPDGRIMVIKRHGNQFAGRILTSAATAREEVDGLVVDCGPDVDSARFGKVRLSLNDSSTWADRINRL